VKRLILVLAGTALLASACATGQSGSLGPGPTDVPVVSPTAPAPSLAPSPAPSPSASADRSPQPARTITVQLWFTRGSTIVPTRRSRPAVPETSQLALSALVAGPSTTEAAAGIGNRIAPDTTFDIVGIAGGVATVNFAPAFYSGGRDAARLRQAQVVYTLTQFPTVSRVGFQSAHKPTGWPVGRSDYADLLPPIVVTDPVIGQRVTSPVNVAGTANVFEATVSIRVLDAAGSEIATTFTTATCGSGCRGEYSVGVSYQLTREQRGTIEVYEASAEDGSHLHVVAIPVILAASGSR
jgi:hypothetical protein